MLVFKHFLHFLNCAVPLSELNIIWKANHTDPPFLLDFLACTKVSQNVSYCCRINLGIDLSVFRHLWFRRLLKKISSLKWVTLKLDNLFANTSSCTLVKFFCENAFDSDNGFSYLGYLGWCDTGRTEPNLYHIVQGSQDK